VVLMAGNQLKRLEKTRCLESLTDVMGRCYLLLK